MQLTFLKLARLCKDRAAELRKKKTRLGARIKKYASEVKEGRKVSRLSRLVLNGLSGTLMSWFLKAQFTA